MKDELYLEAILSSIQAGVIIIDVDRHEIVDVNEAAAKLIGASKERIIGRICHNYVCPAEKGKCPITDLKQVIDNSERTLIDINGKTIPILKTVVPVILKNRTYLFESFIDITDRKLAEESLRASEERFRSLTESTSDWIWEVDQYGVYTYSSPKVKDLLGYEPNEIIGKSPFDLMPIDELQRISEIANSIIESRMPFAALENTNLHKDGRRVILETSGVPIFDKDGNFSWISRHRS